jgi:mono/diheme cytochrome c family protein
MRLWYIWLATLVTVIAVGQVRAVEPTVDFARDIRPIFEHRCFKCHGAEKQKSGYRLDVRSRARAGGESGEAAIVSGKPTDSALLVRVTSDDTEVRMPPEGERLSARELELVRAWIEAGAPWPDALAGEDRTKKQHWAFQAPVPPNCQSCAMWPPRAMRSIASYWPICKPRT